MEPVLRRDELFAMLTTEEPIYTTADIEALPEGQRAELIDGKMYMMASPSLNHQEIPGWLYVEIFSFIRSHGGKCKVLPAPFGVFIRKDDKNYFEPDISVICDWNKLDQKGCRGASDWVIEIVSPSSRLMDYQLKLPVYREAGVQKYWILDYDMQKIQVYFLQNSLESIEYRFMDMVKVGIYEDLQIDFKELQEYLGSGNENT